MLAFLHTSPVHVDVFERLVWERDTTVPVRHAVHEQLLADARDAGVLPDALRASVHAAVRALAEAGAVLVVCTCSTLGGIAETARIFGCPVLRVDRPLAEEAVRNARRILVVAALSTALDATLDLLRSVANEQGTAPSVVPLSCAEAWSLFEQSRHDDYVRAVAGAIDAQAAPGDFVLLAQASMARAAALVRTRDVRVVSSPELGVEAALSRYRAAR